jgi:hypothetical protein
VVGACLVCALGVAFDLAGESLNLAWPLQPGKTVDEVIWGARAHALLSAGNANGLYGVAGRVLSGRSW